MDRDLKLAFPVAVAVSRAMQHEGYLRCEHLLRAFDRALRILAAATCGRYLDHVRGGGERSPEVDAVMAALVRPSLGQWVAIVRDATEALGQRELVTPAFREFVRGEHERLARIVELRNAREHAEDESRDAELEGLITSFLGASARVPELRLTAIDAAGARVPLGGATPPSLTEPGRVRIASDAVDLSPLVVGEQTVEGAVEVFLYHGRHRKKGTLVHMASSRGGTETLGPVDVGKELSRAFDLLVQPGVDVQRAISTRVTASPFRKLRAYSYRDADVFRGREQSVRDVADLIDERALVVLHAPSGTGKTSLLRAGVRPAIDDVFTWIEVEARRDVVAVAAAAIGHELELRGRPAEGDLAERIRALAALTGRSVLLVVDALEELFRGAEDDVERRVRELATALAKVREAPNQGHVLLSIRADYLGQLERLREAGLEGIFADTIALRPLDGAGARAALIEPLAASGLRLGGKLAETIVRDLGGEGQAVSAVELAIVGDALFERAKELGLLATATPDRPATLDATVYASLGGAGQVLATYVRSALAAFAVEERGDVGLLLTSMLGAAGVRLAPLELAQLVERTKLDAPRAERLMGALVDARVVQTSSAGSEARPTFRISHDLVALEVFGQLGEADRRALEVREALEAAARSWHLGGRPRSGFPAAKQLAYYEQARNVSRDAEAFLAGARRASRRRRRIERTALVVMAVLTIAACVAGLLAWRSTRARRASLRDALASQAIGLAQVPGRQTDAVASALRSIALADHEGPLAELDGRLASALSAAASAASDGADFVDLEDQPASPSVGRLSPAGDLVVIGDVAGDVSLFDAQTGRRSKVLGNHPGGVTAVTFSPDGQRIASAGNDHEIALWSARTGERTATLRGHYRGVTSLAFSPDGMQLASASEDGTARLWDLGAAREQRVIRGHGSMVFSVEVSPDGTRILVAPFDGLARVLERSTGRTILELHPSHPQGYLRAHFAEDGRISTASVDGTARIWDGTSGKLLATLTGHRAMVRDAVFSPDGDHIATASTDGTLVLWDGRTYERARDPIAHDQPLSAAAFSGDGRALATASYGGLVRIFDVETGEEVQQLQHAMDVWSVQFIRDDTQLLTTTFEATRIWSLATGTVRTSLVNEDGGKAAGAEISDDGRWIAVAELRGARLWDARTFEQVRFWATGGGATVAFTPDGRELVCGTASKFDQSVRAFDVKTGDQRLEVLPGGGPVHGVAFDLRGRLVTSGQDHALRVWDATTGAPAKVHRAEEAMTFGVTTTMHVGVANPPDARAPVIAVTADDRVVRGWDLETGAPLWMADLLGHVAHDVSVSRDGRLAIIGGRDERAHIVEVATGALRAELPAASVVTSVDLSSDGERALVISHAGARIWTSTRAPLWAPHRLHDLATSGIVRVVLSADGTNVATVGVDGRLAMHERVSGRRRWWTDPTSDARDVAILGDGGRLVAALGSDVALVDAADGRVIARSTGHADGIDRIAVSKDGTSVLSADADSVVRWAVDGDTLEEVHADTSRSGIVSIAFSPDQRRIVIGHASGEIEIVDAATWATIASRPGHRGEVRWVELCEDGTHLVSAGSDQTARVWDLSSEASPVVLRGHAGAIGEAHFLEGCARVVTASDDHSIAVWDAVTGERVIMHARRDGSAVTSVAVTGDAREFVLADHASVVVTGPLALESYLEAACAALEHDPRRDEFRARCAAPLAARVTRAAWW